MAMEKLITVRFVSEAIRPAAGTGDTARMAIGEPGLPGGFVWRGRTISVTAVLRTWRETGRRHHGSPERYVRKHWYEVATASGSTMKIYFDRQPQCREIAKRIWHRQPDFTIAAMIRHYEIIRHGRKLDGVSSPT